MIRGPTLCLYNPKVTNILPVRENWISVRRKPETRDEENTEWSGDSLNPLTEKKKSLEKKNIHSKLICLENTVQNFSLNGVWGKHISIRWKDIFHPSADLAIKLMDCKFSL